MAKMKIFDFKKDGFSRKIIISAIILALVIIITTVFLLVVNSSISKKSKAINQLRSQISEMNLTGETFSVLARDFQSISPYLEDLKNILPSRDKLLDFSQEISNLATSFGMTSNLIFKDEQVIEKLTAVNFSISLQKTDINNLISFLDALHKSPYFVDITSFDISGVGIERVASGEREISVAINGRIFISEEI